MIVSIKGKKIPRRFLALCFEEHTLVRELRTAAHQVYCPIFAHVKSLVIFHTDTN